MRVMVDLPDVVWGALVDVADARKVKVNELVRSAVMALIPREVPARLRIPALVAAGLPDAVIAERLKVSKGLVGEVRRAHGLKPNRFERASWDDEFVGNRKEAA